MQELSELLKTYKKDLISAKRRVQIQKGSYHLALLVSDF